MMATPILVGMLWVFFLVSALLAVRCWYWKNMYRIEHEYTQEISKMLDRFLG